MAIYHHHNCAKSPCSILVIASLYSVHFGNSYNSNSSNSAERKSCQLLTWKYKTSSLWYLFDMHVKHFLQITTPIKV